MIIISQTTKMILVLWNALKYIVLIISSVIVTLFKFWKKKKTFIVIVTKNVLPLLSSLKVEDYTIGFVHNFKNMDCNYESI